MEHITKIAKMFGRNILHTGVFFDPHDNIQVKYEMIRCVEKEGMSITDATSLYGFSRQTFYACRDAFYKEGISGLISKKTGPKTGYKLNEDGKRFIDQYLTDHPRAKAQEIHSALEKEFNLQITVRTIDRYLAKKTQSDESSWEVSMFKVNKDNLHNGEWIITESPNFYLYGSYEEAYLISKKDDHAIACVGDFYGDVQGGIIDPQERFCVTIGCGYIVYFIERNMISYGYHMDTEQWVESGRDPSNIQWYECVKQLNEDEIELTDEFGKKTIIAISALRKSKIRV